MAQRNVTVEGLGGCFACFVILFNIETFLTNRLLYAAEFRTFALIALLFLVLRHRFEWTELDGPGEAA